MSTRQAKVNSLLQKEIAAFILNEGLEDLSGLLTITRAEVSPDLEYAKIYFSVIGQNDEAVQAILKRNVYEIQGMLNRRLQMKKVPRIQFAPDHSGEYAQHLTRLLKNIKEDWHE